MRETEEHCNGLDTLKMGQGAQEKTDTCTVYMCPREAAHSRRLLSSLWHRELSRLCLARWRRKRVVDGALGSIVVLRLGTRRRRAVFG